MRIVRPILAATADESGEAVSAAVVTATTPQSVTDALASRKAAHQVDATWDEASVVEIALSGSTATADSDAVSVDDGTVNISDAGTYRLSGTLAGQVVVESSSAEPVRLILDGVDITPPCTSTRTRRPTSRTRRCTPRMT